MAHDWRDDRIAEQAKTIAEQAKTIAEQTETIAELREQVAQLLVRVGKLEEQVRRSSRNSSQPPSSDGPAAPPRSREPTGRKPGGQEGHEKHERPLVPPEKLNRRVVLKPARCGRCQASLTGSDPSPRRHQVFGLPHIEPIVDEYEIHALECTCGARTTAPLPAGVPSGAFGPSVIAMVAMLMGVYRLSKRAVPALMRDAFGLDMSVGAAVGCQQIASAALEAPVEEAKKFVVEEPVKHADETGWREARKKAWLWTVVTASVTVFVIQASRSAKAAQKLLGRAKGVLVSDRYAGYAWWPVLQRQFCWAHLVRDFIAISERDCVSKRIGTALLDEAKRMFVWWHRVRDGTLSRSTFRVYMRSVQRRVEALLVEGAGVFHPKTAKTCANILKCFDALWTFVRVERVEPTNNTAEHAVRHPVLWRKTSYGTHSADGSRFVERILTTHATLRQQERSILDFLQQACTASLRGTRPPSLLPSLRFQLAIAA